MGITAAEPGGRLGALLPYGQGGSAAPLDNEQRAEDARRSSHRGVSHKKDAKTGPELASAQGLGSSGIASHSSTFNQGRKQVQGNLVKSEHIADGRWGDILAAAGVDERTLSKKMGPCPLCGGKTRCYALDVHQGRLYCHRCGVISGFQVLMHLNNSDFRGAADWIREWHSGRGAYIAPRRPLEHKSEDRKSDDDDVRAKLRKLWDEAKVIREGSPAHRYLAQRLPGLNTIPSVLREHAGLGYWEEQPGKARHVKVGTFPCLLARVQGVDGKGVNIWRTYLDREGNKAPVECAKKAVGRFLGKGYAVRLAEPGDELGVSEGLETALSAQLLRGIPTWSTLSANGMANFELPAEFRQRVKKVVIFADNDSPDELGRRAGNDAARKLRDRLLSQGLKAFIVMPAGTKFDFNDILKRVAQRRAT